MSILYVCSPSERRLWLRQWLTAHEGSRQPDIMRAADDVHTRDLKAFLLRMLSYLPDDRPQITKVCEYIHQMSITGASIKNFFS